MESFVLRFVQDAPSDCASASWRAVVVHVQSNEEKSFTDFADAVAFIARYVPIGKTFLTTEGTEGTEKK